MPACYAHYRFGAQMLSRMPEEQQNTVNRFRRLYDVGLHGPDPFFFYSPVIPTEVGKLGNVYHRQTGREFFTRVCRELQPEPSQEGLSYLYGVLCHYCLDSVCHPYINEMDRLGPANHSQIEGELERFLLEQDGKTPPETQDVSRHLVLTGEECRVASRFYPGCSPAQMEKAVKNMEKFTRFLVRPRGLYRTVIRKVLSCAAPTHDGLLIPTEPDPRCHALMAPLMERYGQAEDNFPGMLREILEHLSSNTPLGEKFYPDFG